MIENLNSSTLTLMNLVQELSPFEQRLRKAHTYELHYMRQLHGYTLSSNVRQQLQTLGSDWDLHPTVLIFNLNRLFNCFIQLTSNDKDVVKQQDHITNLSIEEWFQLLEIYLQMDGKFYKDKDKNYDLFLVYIYSTRFLYENMSMEKCITTFNS